MEDRLKEKIEIKLDGEEYPVIMCTLEELPMHSRIALETYKSVITKQQNEIKKLKENYFNLKYFDKGAE